MLDASISTEVGIPARSTRQCNPRLYARWAGALALVLVVLSAFSMMYILRGDALSCGEKR